MQAWYLKQPERFVRKLKNQTGLETYTALDTLRQHEHETLQNEIECGALAVVNAFEPTTWTQVRFRLWAESRPALAAECRQWHQVGHVSQPKH